MRYFGFLFAILLSGLAAAQASAGPADGIFRGRYECAQGPTGVVLSIATNAQNRIRVIFSFFDLDGDGSVPTGIYELDGGYNPNTRRITTSNTGRWIARPNGYVTVGFGATLSADRSRLAGRLNAQGCTTIAGVRQNPRTRN